MDIDVGVKIKYTIKIQKPRLNLYEQEQDKGQHYERLDLDLLITSPITGHTFRTQYRRSHHFTIKSK